MKKQFFSIATLLLVVFGIFTFTKTAEAKVLPQAKTSTQRSNILRDFKGIGISPKMRKDRRAIIINFSNLQNASAVSYLLTYQTNIQEEGAIGSLNLAEPSNQTSELLFGTCSKNVCRYHTGIRDAKLDISYTLKTGKKYLKKYKIKI